MPAIIPLHVTNQFLVSKKDYVKSKTSKVWPTELQVGLRNMVNSVCISLLLLVEAIMSGMDTEKNQE